MTFVRLPSRLLQSQFIRQSIITSRAIFAQSYIDSKSFRGRRKLFRNFKERSNILQVHDSVGDQILTTEDIQLLIYTTRSEEEQKFLVTLMLRVIKDEQRRINDIKGLVHAFFWTCYKKKDPDGAKTIFDASCHFIDSYHAKNRYFSVLLDNHRYIDIVNGYKKLPAPSRNDDLIYMVTLYKIGLPSSFREAQALYSNLKYAPEGRLPFVYAMFCAKMEQVDTALEISNFDYTYENNLMPKNKQQCNLQIYCLLLKDNPKLAFNVLKSWTDLLKESKIIISSQIIKQLEVALASSDLSREIVDLAEKLRMMKSISYETVEEIILEPIDLEAILRKKKF